MKRETSLTRIARCLTLLTLIFFACLVSARAQLIPFVDCVERADTTHYRAYFGYANLNNSAIQIAADDSGNYFTPVSDPPGQPESFLPGTFHRVVSVVVPNGTNETWLLGVESATTNGQTSRFPCNDAGSNTRTITYQGRLSDGAAAANGQFDLRFQLFDAVSGGTAKSATLALENVPVANGIFTVQLDFGLMSAFFSGGNLFVEIGVRPGTATGAHTILTPRQPITATPYAIRSQSAANADLLNGVTADQFLRADNAQVVRTDDARLTDARTPTAGSGNYVQNTTTTQANSNFNVSGGGTLGGNLTANTVNANSTTNNVINGQSSSPVGTWLNLNNTTTGGRNWSVISSGAGNGEGAGRLVFNTSGTVPFVLSETGAVVSGNLNVSGTISGDGSGLRNISGANVASSTNLNPQRLAILRWYDVNQASLSQPIAIGGSPRALTFDSTFIYVSYGTNSVSRIRAVTGVVEGNPIAIGSNPSALVFDGTFVYVANAAGNVVTRIRAATGAVEGGGITVGTFPSALAFDGTFFYVANFGSGNVTRIRTATGAVEGSAIDVGNNPSALVFDGTFIYIANQNNNSVRRF